MALQEVGPELWIAEGDCVSFYGFPYPTRSVIARLADGGLWVWSPIALAPDLKRAVDALGPVRHLVSPNKIHHLYLQDWAEAYPGAKLWGPASTAAKRSDINFQPPLTDKAPPDWADEIEQIHVTGSPAMDEVVFFHRPSRTLILADLSENFSKAFLKAEWGGWKAWVAGLWGIVEGKGYAPLEWRLSFLNRAHLKRAKSRMLELDPKAVIMAHGEWQRDNGRDYVQRAFKWV